MRIDVCGVRGSTPVAAADVLGVGGNTSCVAITPDGARWPTLVLDAGTGVRRVDDLLGGEAFHGTIALTHLHWDHVQGLPFFASADRHDASSKVVAPIGHDRIPLSAVMRQAMSPPHFPIGAEELLGQWTFQGIDEGAWTSGGLTITAREVPHKGGRTFGYRVTEGNRSIAYVPDHLPAVAGPERDRVLELIGDVDLLFHDAQFTASESARAAAFGHATVDQAQALAREAGVGHLLLFHHSPVRRDSDLRAIEATAAEGPVRTSLAIEGARQLL